MIRNCCICLFFEYFNQQLKTGTVVETVGMQTRCIRKAKIKVT
jgi:hypothetical protein